MGNLKNLFDNQAIEKLKYLTEGIKTCMFCTDLNQLPINTRPMSLQSVDDKGNLWFISSRSSNKNFEIKRDSHVQLFFTDNSKFQYLSVFGEAKIYSDKSIIDDIWTPVAKAWFEEGINDSDVSVIQVIPYDVYYWDTNDNKVISLLKMATTAVTGIKLEMGVEGNLHLSK
jgi:general stress protein 26